MPRIIEKTVYLFSELSDEAKEKAREWYRQGVFNDSCDWDFVYSDAAECAAIIGIEIDDRSYKTIGGGTGSAPCIFFSGFSSQGDGACFEGRYRYSKGATKAIRQHAPQDTELHRIADQLQAVQRQNFYRLNASMKQRGHYQHSGCMAVDVQDSENQYRDIGNAEGEITKLMRDFADWIYSQLEKEYEYQTSDEQVDDAIEANGYEFSEEGERV